MAVRVFTFHYVLTGPDGDVLDSSRDAGPLQVLEGSRSLIPGLEAELFKMQTGDKKKVHVPAANAYGLVNDQLKIKIPRSKLPEGDIQIGTQFSAGPDANGPVFVVTAIQGEEVSLDGNHPLAGMDLVFDVEVTEVRDATADEQQHGHAHGPHGHH